MISATACSTAVAMLLLIHCLLLLSLCVGALCLVLILLGSVWFHF